VGKEVSIQMNDLRTNYKSDILATSQQGKRTFNIVSKNGEVLYEGVHIEDVSQYLQVGDEYDSDVINEQNTTINRLSRGTGLVFETYQDYLDAKEDGEVPVGSIIFIKERNQSLITAQQVTYNDSNVELALDTLANRTLQANTRLDGLCIYDDTERVVGTFFGKTLYKKTYTYTGNLPANSVTLISAPIPNISNIVKMEGRIHRAIHYTNIVEAQATTQLVNTWYNTADGGNICIHMADTAYNNADVYVTLYYTKTT
jgi:hypothetical protein